MNLLGVPLLIIFILLIVTKATLPKIPQNHVNTEAERVVDLTSLTVQSTTTLKIKTITESPYWFCVSRGEAPFLAHVQVTDKSGKNVKFEKGEQDKDR